MIHLAFFVGQLSGADARCLVYYVGGLDFHIAGLVGFVEEELYERALQACAFADVNGESGAGDFHAEVEVDEVIFLGEVPVGQGFASEFGHVAAGSFDYVVGRALAGGHAFVGDVGHAEQNFAYFAFGCGELSGNSLLLFFHFCNGRLGAFGFVFFALLHHCADLSGNFVELGGKAVVFHLQFATAVVGVEHSVDGFLPVKTLYGQSADD